MFFISLYNSELMSSSKPSKNELEKKYQDLYKEEVKFSVLTSIEWYGSLNLMQISQIIGKSEPATYRHVKSLLEDNMIILDNEKTASHRGKFYCLNPKLSNLSKKNKSEIGGFSETNKQEMDKFDQLLSEIGEKELLKLGLTQFAERINEESAAEGIRKYSLVVNNVITSIINTLEAFENKLRLAKKEDRLEELIESERRLVNITQNIFLIKASKMDHVLKINRILSDCYDRLNTLKGEIDQDLEKQSGMPADTTTQFIYTFTGFLDTMFFDRNK